jgi:hypothetical protein
VLDGCRFEELAVGDAVTFEEIIDGTGRFRAVSVQFGGR